MVEVLCDYCKLPAVLVTGKELYPYQPQLHHLHIWQCKPCDARVGCHAGTIEPFGSLANKELRKARMQAHQAFDPIWQSGEMKRHAAYGWLATVLWIPRDKCHIAMFDLEQCAAVLKACLERKEHE